MVDFTTSSWQASSGGAGSKYTFTVSKAQHRRNSRLFIFALWQLVGSSYVRNTWAAVTTNVRYNDGDQSIVLESDAPYDGTILFMG